MIEKLNIILTSIAAIICVYEIFKGNIAVAIFVIGFLAIEYHMWLRGGKSQIFGDKTQIEKDLREIQKLEIEKKLKQIKGE